MRAVVTLLHLAYLLAALYYAGGAIRFFTGSESFFINLIVWVLMTFVMMLPGGVLLILGGLSYYLYAGEDWNIFAIFLFVFPGLALTLLGVASTAIGSIFRK